MVARSSLKFEHSTGSGLGAIAEIENQLSAICDTTSNGVTPETPRMFTSLVLAMKKASSADMYALYKKIKGQQICPSNNKRVL